MPDKFDDFEREVLRGVARGEKREAIAKRCKKSVGMVDNTLQFVYVKCGVRGLVPLTHWAIENGYVKLGDYEHKK